VRWIVTIEGSSRDIKRLVGAYPHLAAGQGVRQVVFLGTAHAHLTPEEFGDMMERLGGTPVDVLVSKEHQVD